MYECAFPHQTLQALKCIFVLFLLGAMSLPVNPFKLFVGGLWQGIDKATLADLISRLGCPAADCGIHIVSRVSINNDEIVLKGLKGSSSTGCLSIPHLIGLLKRMYEHGYSHAYL